MNRASNVEKNKDLRAVYFHANPEKLSIQTSPYEKTSQGACGPIGRVQMDLQYNAGTTQNNL